MPDKNTPIVSIGLPVYNGAKTLKPTLDSLINQSFADFEIIISDNSSDDSTEAICRDYASKDARVRYFRQPTNRGAAENFSFVFFKAEGEYFMWAQDDNIPSGNFVDVCLKLLEKETKCICCAPPNCFDYQAGNTEKYISFELKGALYERLTGFWKQPFQSHGIFDSIVRREAIKEYFDTYKSFLPFLAGDWLLIQFLLTRGEFHRASNALLLVGSGGASMQKDYIKNWRSKLIEFVVPFYDISKESFFLMWRSNEMPLWQKCSVAASIIGFNVRFGVKSSGVVPTMRILYLGFCHHVLPVLLRREKPLGTGQPQLLSRRFIKWWNSE